MQQNKKLLQDHAEVVFADHCGEWLASNLTVTERGEVFDSNVGLFQDPHGKHRLSHRSDTKLAGYNTVEAACRELRVVYQASVRNDVGLIEVVAVGPRRGSEVYDMAHALISSGRLTDDEVTQIWDAVNVLDDTRSRLGLEGWDYFEEPAHEGLVKAAVVSGILEDDIARLLSQSELTAAMGAGWGPDGQPDPHAALRAAMARVASSAHPERVFQARLGGIVALLCLVLMHDA